MAMGARMSRWAGMFVLALTCCWGVRVAAAGFGQKPATQAHDAARQTHTVLIHGFKFQPDSLTVKVGDTVVWKNADMVPHTVTAVDKSFDSGHIAPGGTWKMVAKRAGTYMYNCTPHPNMRAKLIVQ